MFRLFWGRFQVALEAEQGSDQGGQMTPSLWLLVT
jgi:hypothetical protein